MKITFKKPVGLPLASEKLTNPIKKVQINKESLPSSQQTGVSGLLEKCPNGRTVWP